MTGLAARSALDVSSPVKITERYMLLFRKVLTGADATVDTITRKRKRKRHQLAQEKAMR